MRGHHERPREPPVSGFHGVGEPADAVDLGDDVTDSTAGHVVGEPCERVGEVRKPDLTQAAHPERRGGFLAGMPSRGILPVHEGVRGARVDDEQRQPVSGQVERNRLGRPVTAVQQQGVSGRAEHRRQLVHAAGGCPGDVVLGPLADRGQPTTSVEVGEQAEVGQVGQRGADRTLHGRRRGQAGSDGHRTG
ncbi:MAG: hypothetical protein BWY91_03185 [bacterium ADurb.BinA028]|nr:MAG: hypothetical protein BWY91_03185 [bacterium ADurb.BinA028]